MSIFLIKYSFHALFFTTFGFHFVFCRLCFDIFGSPSTNDPSLLVINSQLSQLQFLWLCHDASSKMITHLSQYSWITFQSWIQLECYWLWEWHCTVFHINNCSHQLLLIYLVLHLHHAWTFQFFSVFEIVSCSANNDFVLNVCIGGGVGSWIGGSSGTTFVFSRGMTTHMRCFKKKFCRINFSLTWPRMICLSPPQRQIPN